MGADVARAFGTYLYACHHGREDLSPGTVFFFVDDGSLSQPILRLFEKEYGAAEGEPIFHQRSAADIDDNEQVLLDEAIDELALYNDPDPGLYDPPPPRETFLRAHYASRAARWEEMLRSRKAKAVNNGDESRSGVDGPLSDDVLLQICRASWDEKQVTSEWLDDLRLAASIVAGASVGLEHAMPLLASVLGQLPQHNPTDLPFGHSGPSVKSPQWIERDTLGQAGIQIVGLIRQDGNPGTVASRVNRAVSEAVRIGFLEQQEYDAWRPGMRSGSGWRSAVRATPYGVQVSRSQRAMPNPVSADAVQMAGNDADQMAGDRARQAAGDRSLQSAGSQSTQVAGHDATQLAGMGGVQVAGDRATQVAGHPDGWEAKRPSPGTGLAGWTFDEEDHGRVRARNKQLCRDYAALDEHDLVALSARWRQMAIGFTEAAKRAHHFHGYIVHDEEVQRLTDLLATAMSQHGIKGVSLLGRCLRRPDDGHLHWALAALDELDARLRIEAIGNGGIAGDTMMAADLLRTDGLNRAEVLRCISAFRRARWEHEDSLEWVRVLSDARSGNEDARRHRAATRDHCNDRSVNAERRAAETFPVIMRQAELLGLDVAGIRAAIVRDPWGRETLRDIDLLLNQIEERLAAESPVTGQSPNGDTGTESGQPSAARNSLAEAPPPLPSRDDKYEWARQAELVRATNQVLGQGMLDKGVLSKACKNRHVGTNGMNGQKLRVRVSSFLDWVARKHSLPMEERTQIRNAIIGEIKERNT